MIFIFISNTSIDIFFASSVLPHFFCAVGATTSAGAAGDGGGCGDGGGRTLLFGSVSCYFYAFEIFGSLLAVDFIGVNATNENRHKCTNCTQYTKMPE